MSWWRLERWRPLCQWSIGEKCVPDICDVHLPPATPACFSSDDGCLLCLYKSLSCNYSCEPHWQHPQYALHQGFAASAMAVRRSACAPSFGRRLCSSTRRVNTAATMAPKKTAAPQENVTLGPTVREGELVFGVSCVAAFAPQCAASHHTQCGATCRMVRRPRTQAVPPSPSPAGCPHLRQLQRHREYAACCGAWASLVDAAQRPPGVVYLTAGRCRVAAVFTRSLCTSPICRAVRPSRA